MTITLPHVASRIFNTPLVVHPGKAEAFLSGFGPRLGLDGVDLPEFADALSTFDLGGALMGDLAGQRQPYAGVLDDDLLGEIRAGRIDGYHMVRGAAIVSITGTLIHRGAWVGKSSGQRSYEGLIAQVEAAAEDGRCDKIALETDSFGGEVAGCAALAEAIRRARAQKPVWAFVADHAFSAGYWLASQADRVIVNRTSGTGSIGVIWFHVDRSGAAARSGMNVTPVFSGSRKADGHPYAPLADEVRADIERELGAMRQVFAEDVAMGRGDRLDVDAVLATEAATFVGAEAVEAGLADEVGDLRTAFREFVASDGRLGSPQTQLAHGGTDMATNTGKKTNPEAGAGTGGDDQDTLQGGAGGDAGSDADAGGDGQGAQQSGAGADAGGDDQSGGQGGAGSDAAAAAKTRIKAILTSDEAEGREDLARAMAFDDAYAGLTAEAAIAALGKAPRGTATGTLGGVMDNDDSDLGAGADASGGAGGDNIVAIARARHEAA